MNDTILELIAAIFCALFAAGCIFLLREGIAKRAKSILLALVAEAEEHFGAGTGEIKLSSVLGEFYARVPLLLQILFPKETVCAWVEEALARFKALLSEVSEDDGV